MRWIMCQIKLQLPLGNGRVEILLRVLHLGPHHGQKSIANSHDWEMAIVLFIVRLSPEQDCLYCICKV